MTPEEKAAIDAEQERQIRELATQIASMTKLSFEPMTIRKGIVASVSDATTPPTVSINISGDVDTLVSQVRTLNNYTPLVGQTVLIGKQGTEIFLLGSIASVNPRTAVATSTTDNGWIKATLSNGTHGGSDNDVYYRRVMDHGSWKMQWRGVWNTSGSATMIAAGELDPDYRPASYRAIDCARNSDGAINVRMDFNADGSVLLLTGTPGIATTGDLGGSTGSAGSHAHDYFDDWDGVGSGSNDVTVSSGSHSHGSLDTGSHSHGGAVVIGYPTWVSLNGVEYFL